MQILSISLKIWDDTKIVLLSWSSSIKSRVDFLPTGSKPEVGSSRSSKSGLFIKAAASPRRVTIPVEKPLISLEELGRRSTDLISVESRDVL